MRFSDQRFVMWNALPGWAAMLFTSTLPYVNVERSFASQRLSYPRYQAKTGSAFHMTHRWSLNLTWSPIPRVDLVSEFLFGNRINKDGQKGSSNQLQLGTNFRF